MDRFKRWKEILCVIPLQVIDVPRICEPGAVCSLQLVCAFFDDLSYLVGTFLAWFELRLLSSFCLCFLVEEYPAPEVDLSYTELAIVIKLGLPLVVLCSELCNKSLFFQVVEVSSEVLLVLCLIVGGYS